jgi:glycosyltransferase involved in cell wall biosynthesis
MTSGMTEAEVNVEAARRPRRRSVEISVVAPCYNEMENANALTERLLHLFTKRGLQGEVVLVNDGSRDETGRVIDELARKYPDNVVAVHHPKNQGIAVAWQTGVDSSSGKYVCLIDADLQYLPEEVWRLYRQIEASRADMVQGFRSTIERLKDSRYLYSKALNVLLNVSFGMNLQDNKSGFVIARRDTPQQRISIDAALTWGTDRFAAITVNHDPRVNGRSHYGPVRLVRHAMEMVNTFRRGPSAAQER